MKAIYWFLPDTAEAYKAMQLFKGKVLFEPSNETNRVLVNEKSKLDSAYSTTMSNGRSIINWQSISTAFQQLSLRKEVFVQNLFLTFMK